MRVNLKREQNYFVAHTVMGGKETHTITNSVILILQLFLFGLLKRNMSIFLSQVGAEENELQLI